MSRTPTLVGRTLRFAVPSLAPAMVSLLVLPVLARFCSTEQWAGLAIGQSVGAVAGVVALFGWTLNGPSLVAAAGPAQRWALYEASVRTRCAVAVAAGGGALLVAVLLAHGAARPLAVAAAIAGAAAGLSPRWFNVGTGRPSDILRFEVAPQMGVGLVAVALVASGVGPVVYPALQIGAYVGSAGLFTAVLRQRSVRRAAAPEFVATLRQQVVPAAAEVSGAAYSAANLALVSSQVGLAVTATYASGLKLYQWMLLSIVLVSQTLQGWVSEQPDEWRARARLALRLHVGVGAAGWLALGLVGDWGTAVLFGSGLRVEGNVAWALGAAFCMVSINTGLGRHVLAARGRTRAVFTSTAFGTLIGVPLILVLSHTQGAAGGAIALASSEAVVCLIQLLLARELLRDH